MIMTNLKKLASVLAMLAVLPSASARESDETARASLPPAAPSEGVTKTCEEAQRDAWLVHEMKRTDGEMNPQVDPVPECVDQVTQ
jgi:hypothetical protein